MKLHCMNSVDRSKGTKIAESPGPPTEPGTYQISCDESGNTGENLTQGKVGVFSEGSHDLTLDEAADIIDWLKARTRSQAVEIKWKQLKKLDWLHADLFGDRLRGRAHFYLTEKLYFAVGKVIDLLLEEYAYDHGEDLHARQQARRLAFTLYRNGERALGAEAWRELLQSFNSLMRIDSRSQRLKSTPKTTVDEFFEVLDSARWKSGRRRDVEQILVRLLKTRPQAEDFTRRLDPGTAILPMLDPLVPSLAQTIREWCDLNGSQVIRVLHDEGPLPSSKAMDVLIHELRHPGEFRRMVRPVRVEEIAAVRSDSDARIQVADLVAGFGADMGVKALTGGMSAHQSEWVKAMIWPTSLWGDEASAAALGLD